MKVAGVNFPEPLLAALRENRLVVFAGAGVSMGYPAYLPNFRNLAQLIAEGSELEFRKDEPEDSFLERLEISGVKVRERACRLLERDNPTPTELHSSLLRLYPKSQDVRIVTTNFDTLFEQAAISLFDSLPTVLKAPALPLGQRFNGIVHLHGTLNQPKEMILARSDFGRAYLTEAGGWARRFIVDLFANFTVLFAGYRHRNTIMTYLTPSLPRHDNDRRYALVGDLSGETDHWTEMGIQPLTFDQKNLEDFTFLDEAVKELVVRNL